MKTELTPLDKCLHPVRVFKADGVHYYPCGRCAHCLQQRRSSWSQRLVHAIHSYPAVLFITLHYNNHNLPLVHYDSSRLITSISRTKYDKNLDSYVRVYEDCISEDVRGVLSDLPSSADLPHYVSKVDKINNVRIYDKSNSLNICIKSDVQDFIKRLRSKLSRDSSLCGLDTSVSYFICSEYGPRTFRPHYHGLLFFKDYKVAKRVQDELCFDAWGKADLVSYQDSPMCQLVTRASGAASYVSKYITIPTDLPSCFRIPLFSPFYLFSKKTPIGSTAFKVDDIPAMLDSHSILYHNEFIDKRTAERISYDVPFPNSCWARVFPKFVFLDLLPASSIYHIFRILYSFRGRQLPDTRKLLSERYGIGEQFEAPVSHPSVVSFNLWSFRRKDVVRRSYVFSNFSYDKSLRTSFSSVFGQLYNDPDFWYLYLFGIPQNRSACRKILAAFDTYEWCNSVFAYADMYCKYHTVKFCVAYSYFNCQRNRLLSSLDDLQQIPSELLFYFYPFLFYYFRNGAENVTLEFYNLIFPLYQMFYNIDFEHFVSSLRYFDYRETRIFLEYEFKNKFLYRKDKSSKLYKHDRLENL